MLAQTLKWLEFDGLVKRTSYATLPPHVEYRLSPLGKQVGTRTNDASLPRVRAISAKRR